MAGHSRSKNGVAPRAYARPSTSSSKQKEDVDARDKPAHDGAKYNARMESTS
jgi:hypothetical protein